MQHRMLDFKDLFELFLKKSWIIIVFTIIFTALGYRNASNLSTSYQSRVKVYIGDNSNIMAAYTSDKTLYYAAFIESFKEIIVIEDFLNETLEKYDLGLTAGQVSGALTFVQSESITPILEIRYASWSQELAGQVLNVLVQELGQQAQKIMPDVNVQVVDSVKVYPIYPNKKKVVVTGAAVGFILSVGIILGLDFLDDTIRKKEQLERLIAVPVLGELPHTKGKENA